MGSPPPDFSAVTDVATVWSELLAWLDENAPATAREINRNGASAEEVAEAEARTGTEWTEELRTWFTLQSGVMLTTADSLLFAWDINDLDTAMSSRAINLQVATEVDDGLSAGERDFRTRMARTQAGDPVGWHPAFIPICDGHTGTELVVDLRPGPRRGCVLAHDWEDGGVGMDFADAWPSIAAMLWEHLEVMRTGHPGRIGAVTAVTDEGHLEWQFD
jgi:cell wall assembly regulator SMI1